LMKCAWGRRSVLVSGQWPRAVDNQPINSDKHTKELIEAPLSD
jgi:hypothetical protein